MTLTKEQLKVAEEVKMHLLTGQRIALLSGISGTGKTTTTKKIIEDFVVRERKTVHLTATTHKALEVVSKMAPNGTKASTIHSFLNLIPDRTNYNAPMIKNKNAKPKYAQLLIVDEYSMLTKDVIKYLDEWREDNPHSSILFVGDSSQLIMADKDIDKLGLDNVTSYLTTPMRQGALSDIAAYSKMVSAFILEMGPEPSIPWGEEVIKYDDHKEFIETWKRSKEADKAILAFKNKTVDSYNKNIAKKFRNQKNEYEPGNRVVLRSVVFTSSGEMIPNRRTVTIEEINDMELVNKDDKYYDVLCEYGWFKIPKTAQWLNKLTKKYADRMDWSEYYSIREKYVQVHHADALTVHGSQGSSYEEVFIDATDIMTAHENVRRMAYVAISRAKKTAHIFMGDKRDYSNFENTLEDLNF